MLNVDPAVTTALDRPDTPWDIIGTMLDEVHEHDPLMFSHTTYLLKSRLNRSFSLLLDTLNSVLIYLALNRQNYLDILNSATKAPCPTPLDFLQFLNTYRQTTTLLLDSLASDPSVFGNRLKLASTIGVLVAIQHSFEAGVLAANQVTKARLLSALEGTLINRYHGHPNNTNENPHDAVLVTFNYFYHLRVETEYNTTPAQQRVIHQLYQDTLDQLSQNGFALDPHQTEPPGLLRNGRKLGFHLKLVEHAPVGIDWVRDVWLPDATLQLSRHFKHTVDTQI